MTLLSLVAKSTKPTNAQIAGPGGHRIQNLAQRLRIAALVTDRHVKAVIDAVDDLQCRHRAELVDVAFTSDRSASESRAPWTTSMGIEMWDWCAYPFPPQQDQHCHDCGANEQSDQPEPFHPDQHVEQHSRDGSRVEPTVNIGSTKWSAAKLTPNPIGDHRFSVD